MAFPFPLLLQVMAFPSCFMSFPHLPAAGALLPPGHRPQVHLAGD